MRAKTTALIMKNVRFLKTKLVPLLVNIMTLLIYFFSFCKHVFVLLSQKIKTVRIFHRKTIKDLY